MKSVLKAFMTLAVISVCAIGPVGCNDKSENIDKSDVNEVTVTTDTEFNLTQGVYMFEDKELNIDEDASVVDYYIKDNYLYFTYIKYPEYSEAIYPEADETVAEETQETDATEKTNANDKTEVTDDIAEKEELVYPNIYEDISDDELLGNLDELFGDDAESDEIKSQEIETQKPEVQHTEENQEQEIQGDRPENVFCKYDIETGEITKLYNIESDLQEDNTNVAFFIDNDGNKKTLTVKYDANGNMSVIYSVNDEEGKEISVEDVTDYFIKEGDDPDEIYIEYTQAIAEDGTMYIAVYGSDKVELVKFKDGKSEGTILIEGDVSGVAIDKENKPVALLNDEESKIVYLDFENETIGEDIYRPEDEYISGEVISGKTNVSFFIKTTSGLSIFDTESKEKTDILNWIDCGLLADNVISIMPYDNGKLFCIYMDESGVYKVGFLVRQEGTQVQKKVVEVVSLYINYNLQEKIISFNKTSDDCKIEYRTYEDKEDVEKSFANDIIAGNIPDIIDITGMDINNFMAKGLFEDLRPYIEKDKEINREYFVDGVLDVTARDGKNYFLVKNFALIGLAGKKTEYGKYADGWTIKELIESYNSRNGKKILVPYESKSTVVYEFLFNDINSYVDWDTGEVNFNNGNFKKVLEFCNSFPEDEDEIEVHKEIQSGKLMLNNIYLSDFNEMQLMEKMYDGDIVYLGVPSEKKKGMSFICASDAYAISSTSECKEEAWEFIKHVMLSKDEEMQGFPSSQAEFDKYVKRETTTVEYTEEDGTFVKPKDEVANYDNFEVKLTPMKEDMVNKLKELLKESTMVSEEYEISYLIEDDINSYFEGEKTLDDTIKIIQDKVSKYVNENK